MTLPAFQVESLRWLVAMTALAIVAVTVVFIRRPALPRLTAALGAGGLAMLCLAAGGVVWQRPAAREVVVMIDLSASTRTAAYRDPRWLDARVRELLGVGVRHRLAWFAETVTDAPPASDASGRWADLPGTQTVFARAATDGPIVLFTDGRFDPPAVAPPTYVVVDPSLDAPPDAAVTSLEVSADEAIVSIRNSGSPRRVSIATPTRSATTRPIPNGEFAVAPPGSIVMTRPITRTDSGVSRVAARLVSGDPWPENDALAGVVPPPETAERWWVGASAPPDETWRRFADPSSLPTDPAALLAPAVIVLANVPADALTDVQQRRLAQYVRDFGGGLLMLGGDRAFAAGGYPGSVLEQLSPLASTPPEPTAHWVLLIDSSGSMAAQVSGAAAVGGHSRWRFAVDAVAGVIGALPPADRVSVGGFARGVEWWVRETAAGAVPRDRLPPPGAAPRGPTLLTDALRAVAEIAADGKTPTHLLVLTDGAAEVPSGEDLARQFSDKQVRLHLLAIGDDSGVGLPALREIAAATGGQAARELDPQRWTTGVRELMRAASPDLLRGDPIRIRFTGDLARLPERDVEQPWNRTWIKSDRALPLAQGAANGESIAMAARTTGADRVIAAAFAATAPEASAMASLVERLPRDPRFVVAWLTGERIGVRVEAFDEARGYLNGERLSLRFVNDRGERTTVSDPLPQAAPGRYAWSTPARADPVIAELIGPGGQVIDRRAISGRYPAEFEAIGNDRDAMRALAARTGGRVIDDGDRSRINFEWPGRQIPLTAVLACAGTALIAAGLVWWRLK